MHIHILTLFPEMFPGPFDGSILRRAREAGLVSIYLYNIRDFATDRHKVVDDYPYGGGPGMVMKPEPLFAAVEHVRGLIRGRRGEEGVQDTPVVLLSPQGRPFTQAVAGELAAKADLILLCGHYEGVDARVEEHLATDQVSIGDYVLTGGELPAMVVADAVARLVPGVLHDIEAARDDSFASGLLQGPQYTRPPVFGGWEGPSPAGGASRPSCAPSSAARTCWRRPP